MYGALIEFRRTTKTMIRRGAIIWAVAERREPFAFHEPLVSVSNPASVICTVYLV